MKRLISFLFLIMVIISCGKEKINNTHGTQEKKNITVTTSFLYDMVNQLAPGKTNLELIIPHGEDPHLYVVKPGDQEKIKKADLLLYHGLHFEGKMQNALEKKGYAVASTFSHDKLGTIETDKVIETDPHFWFDLDLYKEAVKNASEQLQILLPKDKKEIVANTEKYLQELSDLDEENRAKLSQIPKERRILVTPHDAFNYFARRYDVVVMAPQGISTDSEVANKDIEKTVDFIVNNNVKAIFIESTTDLSRMEKLREIAKAKGYDVIVVQGEGRELYSDSLAPAGLEGSTFIDMYRHNVKLITDNLK